eukprot:9054911-Lingulodinium_polyedra.AAC.1
MPVPRAGHPIPSRPNGNQAPPLRADAPARAPSPPAARPGGHTLALAGPLAVAGTGSEADMPPPSAARP